MKQERHNLASTAALQFVGKESEIEVQSLGDGNINDTFLVRCHRGPSFVLQRINRHVFPRPELVVANFQTVTAHLAGRDRRDCPWWRDIHLVQTTSGESFLKDSLGDIWRAQSYLGGTRTFPTINTSKRARQVGLALGSFHRLLSDLPAFTLHETLPGFHVLASYLACFDRVKDSTQVPPTAELRYGLEMVEEYRGRVDRLRQAEEKGLLVPRIIHGDPKADNVLFDGQTGRAVCLIDLDTVRPGLIHYDIGDCLRSCCNPAGEKGDDPGVVSFDVGLAHEILAGYYAGAGDLFTSRDKSYIHDAACLLCFELGLRFLMDFLDGNRYFKTKDPNDLLLRASRQFHLLESLNEIGDVFSTS